MTKIYILLGVLFCSLAGFAQTSRTWVVKSNEDLADNSSGIPIYKYATFTKGRVYLKDGDSSGGRLNLNYLSGTMDFLGPKGDTMYLSEPELIKYVIIDKDTFYYDNGFIELLEQNNTARLGMKTRIRFADKRKIGAFGLSSNTTNIESKDAILDNNRVYKLRYNEDIVLREETTYYISDKKTAFVDATRKNVLNLFSEKKKQLSAYFDANDVQMKKESDLNALMAYLEKAKSN
jgi:hypothetical protein